VLQGRRVSVLNDGGASHNFIDSSLLQRRHIPTVDFEGFHVEVVGCAPCPVTGTFQEWNLLSTFLVFGIGIHRSAGCPRSAQAQRIKEVLFGLEIKRAGSSFFSDKAEQRLMGNCRINQIASSIAPKVLRKSTVGILQQALAKLRGPLIASSSKRSVISRARGS
jgi:hypothetical protein